MSDHEMGNDRVKSSAEILEERLQQKQTGRGSATTLDALKKAADSAPDTLPEAAAAPPSDAAKKLAELQDQLLRTRADFDNFQKRIKREQGEYRDFALVGVMNDVLTAIDTLDMALRAAPVGQGAASVAAFKTGVEMVRGQLEKILDDRGATRVPTVGTTFDPRQHEAILTDERTDVAPGSVTEELRRGYMFKDRVVRAAQVRVAKAPEKG